MKPPIKAPDVELRSIDPITWQAVYRPHRYRFLMSNGVTVDVLAYRDESSLRAALLEKMPADVSIAGMTELVDTGAGDDAL